MGNIFCCCLGVGGRRWRSNVPPAATETTPLQPQHPKEIPVNQPVPAPAAATSSPDLLTDSNPYSHQYPGHCPSPPGTMAEPYDHPLSSPPDEEAVTVRNDTNLRKQTLSLEPDPVNPGRLLVAFTFDALVSGRITVDFFAKEVEEFQLTTTKEDALPPITFEFEEGLDQKFIQPYGTGVDLSLFEDSELFKKAGTNISH